MERRLLVGLGGLDQLLQARFVTRRRVGVQNIPRPGPVKLLGRQSEFGLGLFQITSIHGQADLLDLCSHGGLDRSVPESMNIVLAEPLFGTRCIRHDFNNDDRSRLSGS